jgi:hypothetical protein
VPKIVNIGIKSINNAGNENRLFILIYFVSEKFLSTIKQLTQSNITIKPSIIIRDTNEIGCGIPISGKNVFMNAPVPIKIEILNPTPYSKTSVQEIS